ncbi:MAG: hypothetical protein UMU04_06005 [Halanaerobiales bacterium]|jgi:ATP-dependent protease ClpP protease subunit|nr:hypothetical protein [Halanaerobiales bacterium]
MPTKDEINQEIIGAKRRARASQDTVRRNYLKELSDYAERDVIVYASAFLSKNVPNQARGALSIVPQDIEGFMSSLHGLQGDKLDLILHSPGGALEAAEQIVNYLRNKYNYIRAIIPQNAMSAATMIACACDEILMGKHSAIGPIDPQINMGNFVAPAQSILDEFNEAKEEVQKNPKTAPLWVKKIENYPPGFLRTCQHSIDLSRDKVAEWLNSYMFKGEDMEEKCNEIANWLGDTEEHKTHGRPICFDEAKDHGLKVTALEEDQELQEKVLSIHHSTMITLENTACIKLVENHNGKGDFTIIENN